MKIFILETGIFKKKPIFLNLKFNLSLILLLISSSLNLFSQTESVGINVTPDNSAVFDAQPATTPKGMRIPTLTTAQRTSITSPANGLIIYNSTTNKFEYNAGSSGTPNWVGIISSGNFTLTDSHIFVGNAGAATDVAMTGDVFIDNTGVTTIQANKITTGKILDGTIATADLANSSVDGTKIGLTGQLSGDVMYFNGTNWVRLAVGSTGQVLTVTAGAPSWAANSALSATLAPTHVFVGSAGSVATDVALSGDATIVSNGTLTISSGAITTGKILDGTIATADVANNAIDGTKIDLGSQANGDIMYYNGTDWVRLAAGSNGNILTLATGIPSWAANSALSSSLTNGNIFVGNGSNVATGVTMSGDATIVANGTLTIGAGAITTGKILDGTIANADINSSAAISVSKLESVPTGSIIFGNAGTATVGALGGDAAIGNTGTLTIQANAITTSKIANNAVDGTKIDLGSQVSGDIMYYNGTDWVRLAKGTDGQILTLATGAPSWVDNSALSKTLADGLVFIGSGSNQATARSITGDASITNLGSLTITPDAVTSNKILDGTIANIDVNSNAAIAVTKLETLADKQIVIGNGTANQKVTVSGDATLANTGALTISNDAITNLKILNGSVDGDKIALTSQANGDLMYKNGTSWVRLPIGGSGTILSSNGSLPSWQANTSLSSTLASNKIFIGNTNNAATARTVSGDITIDTVGVTAIGTGKVTTTNILDGTIATGDIANGAVDGTKIGITGQLTGDVMYFNGTAWDKLGIGSAGSVLTVNGGGTAPIWSANNSLSTTLTSNKIFIGNTDNLATARTISGDITIDTVGVTTIGTNAVTSAKIATDAVTNTKIAAGAVTGSKIGITNQASGDLLTFNGGWDRLAVGASNSYLKVNGAGNGLVWATDSSLSSSLASTYVFIGNANGIAKQRAISGDANIDTTGVLTISADAITSTKILNNAVITAKIATGAVDGTKIGLTNQAAGDIMYYDGPSTSWKRLGVGSDGQVLTLATGNPSWATPAAAPTGTDRQTLRYNGTTLEASSVIQNDGFNVGLGVNPTAKMDIDGGLVLRDSSASVGANANITVGNRSFLIISSSVTPGSAVITLDAGLHSGQTLVLLCSASGSNGIRLADSGNLKLTGQIDLLNSDSVTLIYDGTNWIQLALSLNH